MAPRIVAVTSTIEPVGGAEKVLLLLLKGFADILGADIDVVTHLPSDTKIPWTHRCALRELGEPVGPQMLFRLRSILSTFPRGTVLFPFQIRSNILAIMANRSLPRSQRLSVIANDRVSIESLLHGMREEPGGFVRAHSLRVLAHWAYRNADAIVCNSDANSASVRRFIGRSSPPITTIYNPVLADHLAVAFPDRDRSQLPANPLVTAHGRLALPQKGWDLLLRSFSLARQAIPGIRLRIVGDGPARETILRLAAQLSVEGALELTGFTSNPFPLIEQGDVYVLPSRWEGLPNSLLEAMALGLPVVAADCPTGPREILEGGRHGVLVPVDDVAALAASLVDLLSNSERRATLASLARTRALDFDVESAVARYRAVFSNLSEGPGSLGDQ